MAIGAFVGLLTLACPAAAQDFGLVTTLLHPNPRPNNEDRFGSGVAMSGGTLFVGAKDAQGANAYSGVVHVFSDTHWSEVTQLKGSVATDIEFGAIVQLDGERALISNKGSSVSKTGPCELGRRRKRGLSHGDWSGGRQE